MKHFWIFVAVFLCVLTIGYLEPVFFPAKKPRVITPSTQQPPIHQALPHEELKTEGYATFIGKKINSFTKIYGQPQKKIITAMNYTVWVYEKPAQEYLEANVANDRILSIKVFDPSKGTAPFKIGMQLPELSGLMTIYSDFAFRYQEKNYQIELSEEDMNYRPLVAFDNGTFAILFFAVGTGQLIGIDYVDPATLLTVMPYQLNAGELVSIETSEQQATAAIDQGTQAAKVLNLLETKEGHEPFRIEVGTQAEAEHLSHYFAQNSETVLSADRQAAFLEMKENQAALYPFALTSEEFAQLCKQSKLPLTEPSGLYQEPIYDSSFTMLSWFSDQANYGRLSRPESETLGVAFSKENMLVLLQTTNEKTQKTESSEDK
ncbi:CAP-associated domain-containing protein [Enterococcus faecalis]